jgi:type II secretory pathway pseudopilin PulG
MTLGRQRSMQMRSDSSDKAGHVEAGYALVEILAALSISALLSTLLLPIVSHAILHWTEIASKEERLDQILRARSRMASEIAGMARIPEPGHPNGDRSWFRGDAQGVMFTRMLSEPSTAPVLAAVAFDIERDGQGKILVRRFADARGLPVESERRSLPDPTAVLRGGEAMRFAFLDASGERFDTWVDRPDFPTTIELSVDGGPLKGGAMMLSFQCP